MNRVVLLLLVVVVASPLAACGGGGSGRLSKREYERTMQSIQPVLDSDLRDFQPTDFEHVASYFTKLGDEVEDVVKKLGAVRPPRDVETLHLRLANGATKAANAFHGLAAALEGKTVDDVQRVLRGFDSQPLRAALAEVQAARAGIEARGYRISPSGGT